MATLTVQAPDRSIEQRMGALSVANETRMAMSRLKREVFSLSRYEGLLRAATLLELADPAVMAMPVGKLLGSVRKIGRVKVGRLLTAADVRSADRKVRELSERQRLVLARLLRDAARGVR